MCSKCKDNWNEFISFIKANPEIKHIPHNNLSYYNIVSNIQDYLSYIYDDISKTKKQYSAGLMILNSYSYGDSCFNGIDWAKDISKYDRNILLKRIALSFASAEFKCNWILNLFVNASLDIDEDFVTISKEYICDNYPHTTLRIFESSSATNSSNAFLSIIIDYCNTIINNEKTISSIKDFSTPYNRRLAYFKDRIKENEKINKKSEESSIFHSIIKTTPIKYGSRSAFIQNIDDSKTLSESAFHSIEYSTELPRVFTSDPAYYFSCLNEIFGS